MSEIYTTGQLIEFIENAFGEGKLDARRENIQVVCPVCKSFKGNSYNNRKLAIKLSKPNIVHCWVCGFKSKSLLYLLKKYRFDQYRDYKDNFLDAEDLTSFTKEEQETSKNVEIPVGFEPLILSSNDYYAKSAKEYLYSRGITEKEDFWYWKFGISREKESNCLYRIIIPSYNEHGILNYWTARLWVKNINPNFNIKYRNPIADRTNVIFNEINLNWNKEITLVEGPFDLLKCDYNTTPVLGSELDANYKLFQKILLHKTPVLLAFDNDLRAQQKQMKIAELLNEFDIKVRIFENPYKDKDIGDMTKEQFLELKEKSKDYSFEYNLRRKIASIV